MQIKATRDKYLWEVIIEEWSTKLVLNFSDIDPYELVEAAQTILYQNNTKDWWEAANLITNYLNR